MSLLLTCLSVRLGLNVTTARRGKQRLQDLGTSSVAGFARYVKVRRDCGKQKEIRRSRPGSCRYVCPAHSILVWKQQSKTHVARRGVHLMFTGLLDSVKHITRITVSLRWNLGGGTGRYSLIHSDSYWPRTLDCSPGHSHACSRLEMQVCNLQRP